MEQRTFRRFAALLGAALAVLVLTASFAVLQSEEACAAVDKAAVKKAKTYKKAANKLFTVNGAKYCFAKKKVKKGLQKVKGSYYLFNKSSGKMMKNTVSKKGGKYYFFGKNGKRYDHGYKNAGGKDANLAAGMVISAAKIKPSGKGGTSELKKAYKYIINKISYKPVLNPDLKSAWIGKTALKTAKDKGGKCYGYAALTYVTFKALGFNGRVITGTCARGEGKDPTEHAWVQASDGEDGILYDSVFDAGQDKDFSFFNKKIVMMNSGEYSLEEKHYMYYMDV